MKKIITTLTILTLLIIPVSVFAIDLGTGLTEDAALRAGYSAGTTETTFAETLGTVVKAALSLVGIIFTLLLVYAGYLWMTARGEEDKVNKATKIIQAAIVGLIITLAAYSITNFVVPRVLERTTGNTGTIGSPED
ncbi:MAG: hypothetical protein GF349_02570 [Candidatus Magasanikbacteria bacterium]|nr:hypothetical protein [Candidatus Magasanikbacteria bacterium]